MQRRAAADPYAMSNRSTSRLLAASFAAGALALAASGCGSSQATLDPIAQAAEVTTHSGGSQVAISASVEVPGLATPLTMKGGGHFNNDRREGSLTLEMSGFPANSVPGASGGTLTMSELMKDYVIYISSPLLEGKLPNGARWMKLDLNKAFSSLGIDPQSLSDGSTNPAQILSYLKGSTGSPKVTGHEAVRGVQTTRYDGTVSLESVVQHLPQNQRAKAQEALEKLSSQAGSALSYPVSVWIDAHHLVRRMTMAISFSTEGKSVGINIEIENFDFGPTPAVTPPPSSETYDATSLTSSALSSAG